MPLENGEKAPDFELTNDEGNVTKLSDYRGNRVLIFFYPKAATPGCTRQACGFRDRFPQFEESGTIILGVSPDSVQDLSKWRAAEKLPYNLLSDPEHEVADLYGVWGEKTSFGRTYDGIIRSHFIIGADGNLEDVQYNVSPEKSIDSAVSYISG
ncbi:MAG: thioredoxin-dependent thiol peroxidase [Candidatus Promineifilaceae bacterium]